MSAKYRHRGYQDSGDDDRERPRAPRRQELTTEERIQKKSMRHAIDRGANAVVRCPTCGGNAPQLDEIAPETNCPNCSAPLHCCRACKHFSSEARWQCTAAITKAISNKNDGNSCPFYRPTMVLDSTGRRTRSSGGKEDAKSKFDDLFKS